MKIKIKKIETLYDNSFHIRDYIFDMDKFRDCTPAFHWEKLTEDFMDYITNDIEDIKRIFRKKMTMLICQSTKKSLLLNGC